MLYLYEDYIRVLLATEGDATGAAAIFAMPCDVAELTIGVLNAQAFANSKNADNAIKKAKEAKPGK